MLPLQGAMERTKNVPQAHKEQGELLLGAFPTFFTFSVPRILFA